MESRTKRVSIDVLVSFWKLSSSIPPYRRRLTKVSSGPFFGPPCLCLTDGVFFCLSLLQHCTDSPLKMDRSSLSNEPVEAPGDAAHRNPFVQLRDCQKSVSEQKNQAAKQGMDLGIILLHCALSLFFFVSLALCAWSCVCRTECSSLTFRSLAAIAFDHVQHSIP